MADIYDSMDNERTYVDPKGSADGSLGRIDQYLLLKELGGGGFGTVYLAKNTVSGIGGAAQQRQNTQRRPQPKRQPPSPRPQQRQRKNLFW